MDTAVALVQAYLHVNGYFTVAEYPVLEAYGGEHARTVTDLDILAFRFAGAGHQVIRGGRRLQNGKSVVGTDPLLRCPSERPDMIVGEVRRAPRDSTQLCAIQPFLQLPWRGLAAALTNT